MIILNGEHINANHFPNGELNLLDIKRAFSKNNSVINHFVLKYESDSDLMALYFVKKQADLMGNKLSVLSIPYMPYSRMDRAETPETPFMLKYVCDFINDMNFDSIYVHEAHSMVAIELLNQAYNILDNVNLLKKVKDREGFMEEIDYIVFPDKGAYERYEGEIESKNMLFGNKVRDFSTGQILGLEIKGDTNNISKHSVAIIVDDLSSFGGTFIKVSEELRFLGFNRVVLLVCHSENSIFRGKLFDYIDKVYTTDSMLTEHIDLDNANLLKKGRLEVFNMIQGMREGRHW